MKTTTLFLLPALCLALPALAQEAPEAAEEAPANRSPEAVEILEQADAAAKAVTAVRYKATVEPTGIATHFVGAAEGEGLMTGWDEVISRPQKFFIHLKTQPPGSDAQQELTGGGDGDTFYLIDHKEKKAYEDMDPGVMGSTGMVLFTFGFPELLHPKPFERQLQAETIEYLGVAKVGGEKCHQVRIVAPGGQGEVVWSFAKKDLLPRQQVQKFSIPQQGDGELTVTLTDLDLAPEIDAALFKLKLPEGYEQIDDFAP